jgi:hypothetical protein
MIVHRFRDVPDYPFARYFDDPAQFIQAQQYGLAVLRDVTGFDEVQWQPTPRAEDLADDMYVGKVLDLVAPWLGKAMSLQTFSLEGTSIWRCARTARWALSMFLDFWTPCNVPPSSRARRQTSFIAMRLPIMRR